MHDAGRRSPWSVRPRRVFVALFWALLVPLALLFAGGAVVAVFDELRADHPLPLILVGCPALALGFFVVFWRAARRELPHLAPDAPGPFRVTLPSGVVYAAALVLALAAGLGWLGSVLWLIMAIFREAGASGDHARPLALGAGALTLAALSGAFWLWAARRCAIGLAIEGDTLVLRALLSKRRLQLSEIWSVRRYRAAGGAPLHGLELAGSAEPIRLQTWRASAAQGRLLDELADWLVARSVPEEWHETLFPATRPSLTDKIRFGLCVMVASLLAVATGLAVAVAAGFWWDWWRHGGWDPERLFSASILGCAFGFLLILSPLSGWVVRLLGFGWLGQRADARSNSVLLSERPVGRRSLVAWHAGQVRAEGDALIVAAEGREWRIGREDAVRVAQLRSVETAMLVWDRQYGGVVELTWRAAHATEDGAVVVHSLLIEAQGTWTNWGAAWRDRRLFRAIGAWRDGRAADLCAAGLRRDSAPPWGQALLGMLAVLFLVCLACGHNFAIAHRVRTGQWQPPVRPELCRYAVPAIAALRLEAPAPGELLLSVSPLLRSIAEDAASITMPSASAVGGSDWSSTLDPVGAILLFELRSYQLVRADVERGIYLPVASGPLAPLANGSFPGGPLHLLCHADGSLGLLLFPPDWSRTWFTKPTVVSIQTGRAREVETAPTPWQEALYEGKRLFVVDRIWPDNGWRLAWTDLATGERHDLGTDPSRAKDEVPLSPLFFPGGERVLWHGQVVDLATGTRLALAEPGAEDGWEPSWWHRTLAPLPEAGADAPRVRPSLPAFARNAFARGKDIAVQAVVEKGGEKRFQVWEIDPGTGNVTVLERLSEFTQLLSVDGDRWLVARTNGQTGDAAEIVYGLYAPGAGSQWTPLLREKQAVYLSLERGTDNLLRFTLEEGWTVRKIRDLTGEFTRGSGPAW